MPDESLLPRTGLFRVEYEYVGGQAPSKTIIRDVEQTLRNDLGMIVGAKINDGRLYAVQFRPLVVVPIDGRHFDCVYQLFASIVLIEGSAALY